MAHNQGVLTDWCCRQTLTPKITMKLLTTKQVVVRIAVIISLSEFLVMMVLRTIPHEASTYSGAFIDVALLVVLSTPSIYIWVIKPFVNAREEALAQVNLLALTDPLTQLAV